MCACSVLEKLLPGGAPFVTLKLLALVVLALAVGRWCVWPHVSRAVQGESMRLSVHLPEDARADDKTA